MKIAGGQKIEEKKAVVLPVFRGLGHVRPLKFNPTKADMQELGHPYPKDEKYLVDGKLKLSLLCEYNPNKNFKGKSKVSYPEKMFVFITVFLENKDVTAKSGSFKFINGGGKTCYKDSISNLPTWYDKTSVRVAKAGEEELYKLLLAISNRAGTIKDPLTNFPLSDDKTPEEIFETVLTGDMDLLNNLLIDKDESGSDFEDAVFTNIIEGQKVTRMINALFYENEYENNLYQAISPAVFCKQNSTYMDKNDKDRFASGELDKRVRFTNLTFCEVTAETIEQENNDKDARISALAGSSIEEAPVVVDDAAWDDNGTDTYPPSWD